MNLIILIAVFLLYFVLVGFVGYLAWRKTSSSEDFLVAGRKTHPYIMAMSYGATFISTAAIVGFGGIAGEFGLGILWLPVLNIFVGIFIAFVFLGKRTRAMGHNLGSLTFPEFLSRRFDSKFIQYFSSALIFLAMPLYAAVVLIGAGRFMETAISIDFTLALLILSLVVLVYVYFGGIRGVMYTDALQGTIMFLAMIFLLIFTYWMFGGVGQAHTALTNLAPQFPAASAAAGGAGWTSFPTFNSPFWWTLVSTIIIGVGIGVLAQPQLAVRFMTVKSNKELNRGVLIGGIFIAVMTGTAYIVGALSNVYFFNELSLVAINVVQGNVDKIIPTFISSALPEWFIYVFLLSLLAASMSTLSSQYHTQGTALGRDIYKNLKERKLKKSGQDLSINEKVNSDKTGTSSVLPTRISILIAVIMAFILSLVLPGSIIALGTSLFFGICAAAFSCVYVAALYWKRATRQGAIAGIVSGTITSLFWLLFVFKKTAAPLEISNLLTGQPILFTSMPWPVVDAILIAVPVSLIFTIVVSLFTKPMNPEHVDKCYKGIK